jgi:hypothetical protein
VTFLKTGCYSACNFGVTRPHCERETGGRRFGPRQWRFHPQKSHESRKTFRRAEMPRQTRREPADSLCAMKPGRATGRRVKRRRDVGRARHMSRDPTADEIEGLRRFLSAAGSTAQLRRWIKIARLAEACSEGSPVSLG